CPPRLGGDAPRRRELLAWALRGCVLALQDHPAPRGRLILLAEPGLTAPLLYAAARLLPRGLADRLTLSPYENAQPGLRGYRQARVVGTCLADPGGRLEDAYFTSRGYALDTFGHTCSAELRARDDLPVEEWVDLAGRGEWAAIDKAHGAAGRKATSLVPL